MVRQSGHETGGQLVADAHRDGVGAGGASVRTWAHTLVAPLFARRGS
eukprot:SAG31_NODE_6136_length_2153_cov_9.430867_2_plen_46_part_01